MLDAVTDSELWPSVLEDIAAATGSHAASIVPFDRKIPNAAITSPNIAGLPAEYLRAGLGADDWQSRARILLLRDGITRTQQHTPLEILNTHPFYQFLSGFSIKYSCLIEWHAVSSEILCLGLHRSPEQGPYTDEEAELLGGIRERLMAIAGMARRISQNRLSGTITGLDIAGMAAIFLDPHGKVTHINKVASGLLGAELRVVDGEIRSRNDEETGRIRNAVQCVLRREGSAGNEYAQTVAIERTGRPPLMLRIHRLAGEIDLFARSVCVCVINIPEQHRTASPDALRRAFGLTEQESYIAMRLCEGLSLRDISEETSRSYETVRTHMKSILQKTGTSRQGELIALVAKMKMFEVVPEGAGNAASANAK